MLTYDKFAEESLNSLPPTNLQHQSLVTHDVAISGGHQTNLAALLEAASSEPMIANSVPELTHRSDQHCLCTHQLNQDPLELFFAQIRSLGGSNYHPRAADFCSRFRTLVMCSNSQTDNLLSPNANVTPDTEVTDLSWNAFSAVEEGGEDFSNVDNDGFLEKNEVEELEYELPGRTDRDAVEYLVGYIARKVCCD